MSVFLKDPDATLDYYWNWSDWLADSETIISYTVTVPPGITLDSDSETDGVIAAWLSGGTKHETYVLVCHIETSAGRQDVRTMTIEMRRR